MNRKNSAFTLIEMSLTILLLGIVLIGAINFQVFITKKSKENITTDKMKVINQSIREYFVKHNYLPCPSNIDASQADSLYGQETRTTNETCEPSNSNFVSGDFLYGGVPTRALGLSDDYMIDAWNNKIAFIVVKKYSENKIFLAGDTDTITVKNVAGDTVNDNIIYVLVSGSNNRNGVFRNTEQLSNNTSLIDSQNAFKSGFTGTFIKDVNNDNFDDIVLFKDKKHLVFEDGLENLPCTLKDLRELDSDWNYTSFDDCSEDGVCKQGVVIPSLNECPDGKISKNPENLSDTGVSYRPARKCLKYGQWSDILFKCIAGCGESNISSLTTNMVLTAGELANCVDLNYLKRGKIGEQIVLQCIGERVGYITLECLTGGTWEYVEGDCYNKVAPVVTCDNTQLNSNSYHFTFSTTTGATEAGQVVYGTCSSGYELESGGTTAMATCQSDGTWSFSGGDCTLIGCNVSDMSSDLNDVNDKYYLRTWQACTDSTCTTLTDIVGGFVAGNSRVLQVACVTGYYVSSGTLPYYMYCDVYGVWHYLKGSWVCSAIVCQNSALNSNTNNFTFSTTSGTTSIGGILYGSCSSGYTLGSGGTTATATCQSDGTWSFSGGPCILGCSNSTLNTSNTLHFYFSTTTGTTASGSSVTTTSCATGYTLSGSATTPTATCNSGTWSFSGGPCLASCSNSSLGSNTVHYIFSTTTGTTTSGSYVTASSCASGYAVAYGGSSTLRATCSDGSWVYSGGPCEATCSNSTLNTNPSHFYFTGTSGTTTSGYTKTTTSCATGYTLSGSATTPTATCNNGTWSYSGGPCLASCSNNTLNNNTVHFYFTTTTGTTTSGSYVNASSCSTGYAVAYGGTTTRRATCTDGTWVYTGGPCEATCSNSTLNSNSVHFYFSSTSGTTTSGYTRTTTSCATGYSLPSTYTTPTATCGNGTWSFSGGPCSSNCTNSTLNNNTVHYYFSSTSGTTAIGSSVNSTSCATGYSVVSGSTTLTATCSNSSTWTFSGGTCTPQCLNSVVNSNSYHYYFGTTGTYTDSGDDLVGVCAFGYFGPFWGIIYATCNEGVWSYSGGDCI